MKRSTITSIALALALLLMTGTVAFAATFEGKGIDDRKVGVSFERERGVIKRFTIENVRLFCADGQVFRDGTRLGRMEVRRTRSGDKKFSGYFSNTDGTQTTRVNGRFTSSRRVSGAFRTIAVFDRGGCDTRRVDWQARIPRS